MRQTKRNKAVAVFSAGLLTAAVVALPATAQAVFGAAQIAAVQSLLRNALKLAKTEDEQQLAIAAAHREAISIYGHEASRAITSAIISTAERDQVGECTIGRGLGSAAANVALTRPAVAGEIASSLANEGKGLERNCFQQKVREQGLVELAEVAAQPPGVTGSTGTTGATGGIGGSGGRGGAIGGIGGGFSGGGTSGGGGCLNPSCTKL
ncbi:putative membrane protein YgcG [Rhizomicrobium palustre]|uniref:Putative membrane protein YgcG n=1 Tax=Rhizomicrobium palustre TaxID=189966 RepID=A0A846MYQ4_9PROT|nr:hypothetical protein [Rhizomicrobium palustre]NIK88345.1 putative membrane protein YgcG [Rhizomicrobium palustre]